MSNKKFLVNSPVWILEEFYSSSFSNPLTVTEITDSKVNCLIVNRLIEANYDHCFHTEKEYLEAKEILLVERWNRLQIYKAIRFEPDYSVEYNILNPETLKFTKVYAKFFNKSNSFRGQMMWTFDEAGLCFDTPIQAIKNCMPENNLGDLSNIFNLHK